MAEEIEWGPDNPHPLSQIKTELIWEGKYDEYGNKREVNLSGCDLPLQKVETIDEPFSHAQGAGQLEFFRKQSKRHDDFRNMLIWGDNKLVMASLLREFKGKIELIYIDPPFDVGADFTMNLPVGDTKETLGKDQSILEAIAYKDMWGKGTDSYLHMMHERLIVMRALLAETGSIYVHCDWRVNSLLRLALDEVFGRDSFQREIIWDIRVLSGYKSLAKNWIRGHDTLWFFSKNGNNFTFNKQFTEHRDEYLRRFNKVDGKGKRYFDGRGGRRYLDDVIKKGKPVGDVWDGIMSFQQIPKVLPNVKTTLVPI